MLSRKPACVMTGRRIASDYPAQWFIWAFLSKAFFTSSTFFTARLFMTLFFCPARRFLSWCVHFLTYCENTLFFLLSTRSLSNVSMCSFWIPARKASRSLFSTRTCWIYTWKAFRLPFSLPRNRIHNIPDAPSCFTAFSLSLVAA